MEKTKRDYEEKYLEERYEDVTFRRGQKNERKKSGHPAIEDSGTNIRESWHEPLVLGARFTKIPMSHVSRVVDTESDGDDQVVARHRVDRQPPEVHEPADLHQAQHDA